MEAVVSRRENIKKLIDPSIFETEYFKKNMDAIKELANYAAERGVDFYVAILPILVDTDRKTFEPDYQGIRKRLGENRIEYFDLTSSVSSYKDSRLWILPFDQHPNEIASELFAKRLAVLLKNKFLDRGIQP